MDQKINPLSFTKKRLLLIAFCFLLSGYCVFLLLAPFRDEKSVAVKVEPIQWAKPEPKAKALRPEVFIPDEQYKRIHAFKLYLDSLAKDGTGRRLYDSILAMHPGITDSLQQIEDYYQLQK
jgi:hypothetical protein